MQLTLALTLAIAIASITVVAAATSSDTFTIDPEFEKVTCGSAIKLVHAASGFRLHSHGINYGSGSGQQSTTGFPDADDPK